MSTGVRSCYDEGKRVAETLMFDYHRQHGLGNLWSSFLHNCLFFFVRYSWYKVFLCNLTDFLYSFNIEIRVARIFNTYGPRMNIDDGRVVSNFIAQALR